MDINTIQMIRVAGRLEEYEMFKKNKKYLDELLRQFHQPRTNVIEILPKPGQHPILLGVKNL